MIYGFEFPLMSVAVAFWNLSLLYQVLVWVKLASPLSLGVSIFYSLLESDHYFSVFRTNIIPNVLIWPHQGKKLWLSPEYGTLYEFSNTCDP